MLDEVAPAHARQPRGEEEPTHDVQLVISGPDLAGDLAAGLRVRLPTSNSSLRQTDPGQIHRPSLAWGGRGRRYCSRLRNVTVPHDGR